MPEDLVEPALPSMEVAGDAIGGVVLRELVGFPFQRKSAMRDPIAAAADDAAEVRRVRDVALNIVEAENDISEVSPAIRREESHDGPAIV